MITCEKTLKTEFGEFTVDVFNIRGREIQVLRKGNIIADIKDQYNVPCLVQSPCFNHFFFDVECDCRRQIRHAMGMMQKSGLIIYLDQNQEGEGNGISKKMSNDSINDLRDYSLVVEILRKYGIASVNLISINKRKIETIQNEGLLGANIFYMENFIELHNITERVLSKIEKGENYQILRHTDTESRRVFCYRRPQC